jgi:outer membrane usher protein
MGIRRMTTDEDFVQLGYPEPGQAPAETVQASIGGYFGGGISVNLGGFRRRHHDGSEREVRTAGMNIRLGNLGSLHLGASKPVEPEQDPFYTAFLTIPLGSRSHVSASAGGSREVTQHQVSIQRKRPSGPGIGYRIEAGERNDRRFDEADLALQGDSGLLRLAGTRRGEATTGRAQLTGAVIFSGEGAFLSRRSTDSYGIVKLPGENVRVYHDERLAAVTDGDGEAVIPGLRPYEANRLRLAVEDLPLDTTLKTGEIEVTAGRRQAVSARFRAEQTRQVAGRLMRRGGEPVPAGAVARTTTGPVQETVIGYNGQLYMPLGERERVKLWVKWPGGQCRVNTALRPSNREHYTDLGPLRCVEAGQ